MYLAIGTPPAQIVAVLAFLVATVLCAKEKNWTLGLIAFGLAALSWPW